MNAPQYIILFCYGCLFFNKASRKGAFIIFTAFVIYSAFVIGIDWRIYYALSALINLILIFLLIDKYMYAAYCSLSLIFINIYGFILCYNRYSLEPYDDISLFVLVLQLITILPKGAINGLIDSGGNWKRFMVRSVDFDGSKKSGIMCKDKTTKIKHR